MRGLPSRALRAWALLATAPTMLPAATTEDPIAGEVKIEPGRVREADRSRRGPSPRPQPACRRRRRSGELQVTGHLVGVPRPARGYLAGSLRLGRSGFTPVVVARRSRRDRRDDGRASRWPDRRARPSSGRSFDISHRREWFEFLERGCHRGRGPNSSCISRECRCQTSDRHIRGAGSETTCGRSSFLAFRTSRVQFAPPPDPPAGESRSAVGGGGDGEQVEDLLLQRVEFRFEGLHVCTVAV